MRATSRRRCVRGACGGQGCTSCATAVPVRPRASAGRPGPVGLHSGTEGVNVDEATEGADVAGPVCAARRVEELPAHSGMAAAAMEPTVALRCRRCAPPLPECVRHRSGVPHRSAIWWEGGGVHDGAPCGSSKSSASRSASAARPRDSEGLGRCPLARRGCRRLGEDDDRSALSLVVGESAQCCEQRDAVGGQVFVRRLGHPLRGAIRETSVAVASGSIHSRRPYAATPRDCRCAGSSRR